jgi:glycosyltransferase involved in cell wall biosynthesis
VKPCIVVSGVNLTEMGPLSVFRDGLKSLAEKFSDRYEIVALVHRQDLLNIPGVKYVEFPDIKSSWLKRIRFEYWTSKKISERLLPKLWLSMDNMTPNVISETQAVYCHNPSPFWPFKIQDFMLDWKFGLFTLFYGHLYRINISRNNYVIVQQDWIRRSFQRRYGVKNVIVSHPSVNTHGIISSIAGTRTTAPYRFFYPAYPRTFKNAEVALKAARLLEAESFNAFELWLTFDQTVTKYAAAIAKQFSDVRAVRWLGILPRQRILELYAQADCLLFPSKLETWGLPITEFKATGKPILAADLPYAHETIGDYGQVALFAPDNFEELAKLMKSAASGKPTFSSVAASRIAPPFSRDWSELWSLLLPL